MNCLIVIIGSHGSDEQLPPTTRIGEGIAARLKRRPKGTGRSACGMVAPGPNSWLAACAGMLRCSSASVPEPQATGITIVNGNVDRFRTIVSTTEDGLHADRSFTSPGLWRS